MANIMDFHVNTKIHLHKSRATLIIVSTDTFQLMFHIEYEKVIRFREEILYFF